MEPDALVIKEKCFLYYLLLVYLLLDFKTLNGANSIIFAKGRNYI